MANQQHNRAVAFLAAIRRDHIAAAQYRKELNVTLCEGERQAVLKETERLIMKGQGNAH
jgi:hypothetical protein